MSTWFDTLLGVNEQFMPHGHCYLWQPDILWTHVVADTLIAASYISIPISIAIIARKKSPSPGYAVAMLFAAFIILCGLTHLFNIYVIWNPAYELQSYIKGVTAMVSLATAIVVISKIQHFMGLLTVEESNKALKSALKNSEDKEAQIGKIFDASETRELRIIELKNEINELLAQAGKPARYNMPAND